MGWGTEPAGPPLLDAKGVPMPAGELQRAFGLGHWLGVERLTGGKNEHFRLTTEHGAYFLRRSYRAKTRQELEAQLHLMRVLRHRGLPVPVPAPTPDGTGVVEVDGRLYVATAALPGERYDVDNPAHLHAAGRTLARYHALVSDLDPSPLAAAARTPVHEELPQRAEVSTDEDLADRARGVSDELRGLWPALPSGVNHGGWRRGSLLYSGDAIAGVLDLDSARPEVRLQDLATAVHDFGKVYREVGADGHKVPLDLDRVSGLLRAYGQANPLRAEEVQALPLLLAAARLKRALGRSARHAAGEQLSVNDLAKIELEKARLDWLDRHRERLVEAVATAARPAA